MLLIERELIGGECSNWACIPTKTLLRPTEVRGESERAAGRGAGALAWPELARYRDYMTSAGDDSSRVKGYEEMGVTVVKGDGRLAGPGRLEVDGREFETEPILISTGSDPVIPPIDGLARGRLLDQPRGHGPAASSPRSAMVIGGGPVGIELAQFLRRFGTEVSLVQGTPRLAEREDERVSRTARPTALRAAGIDVHLGVHAQSVRRDGDERVITPR